MQNCANSFHMTAVTQGPIESYEVSSSLSRRLVSAMRNTKLNGPINSRMHADDISMSRQVWNQICINFKCFKVDRHRKQYPKGIGNNSFQIP